MARSHQVTINGTSFPARHGELLLDAALNNGVDLPYDCRAGHCGTCCVRLVSGDVRGGEGSEPGIVHPCQCRIVGDVVVVGSSVARAFDDLYFLERAAQVQVLAQSTGGRLRSIPDQVAEGYVREDRPNNLAKQAKRHFDALLRILDREEPDYRD